MPELPEVETIRMGLEQHLVGHSIKDVEIRFPKIVSGDTKNILGAKVVGVRRFGKGLVIDLDNDFCIAIHIKLTGQLVYRKGTKGARETEETKVKIIKGTYGTLPSQHTHVIFHLDKNAKLFYNDFRRFGWIKIIKQTELQNLEFFKGLGPEFPMRHLPSGSLRPGEQSPIGSQKDSIASLQNDKEILSLEKFAEILGKAKTAIKPFLLDQKRISGLGNIYTNDGLNLAKIDPQRKANTLSATEVKTLYESLKTVLARGLKYGGASELSYINALGGEGKYQEHFLTYGRDGEKCFNCGGIIKRITLGGRGTFYCSTCQK